MKRKFLFTTFFLIITILMTFAPTTRVIGQEIEETISLTTPYPSLVAELGETVNLDLDLKIQGTSQTIDLEIEEIPEGWEASFKGGGRIIHSVFVEADTSASIDLQLTPPEDQEPDTHKIIVSANGETGSDRLTINLTIAEKVPASLVFETDLPTIKGSPTTTFRYSTTLKNNGDQELTINLSADTPAGFLTKFTLSGKEVTGFLLEANQSKSINVELDPISDISAGEYPIRIYASGGELQAQLDLTAVVTGQHDLSITGVDGRLSAKANAGKETSIQVMVKNTGTAPAQGVELSSSAPSGWNVEFDPKTISEIPAGEQVEVTTNLTPPEKAIAGDYMVTLRAKPVDGTTESAEFRITVTTSTLWGIAGVALIAVAVAVVAIAVIRFGRR